MCNTISGVVFCIVKWNLHVYAHDKIMVQPKIRPSPNYHDQ